MSHFYILTLRGGGGGGHFDENIKETSNFSKVVERKWP